MSGLYRWKIAIVVSPHSTGKGKDVDQAAAGEREPYFYVSANSIEDALAVAHAFAEGIKHNPAVWEANIVGIGREDRR